jgi:hypothetical protein
MAASVTTPWGKAIVVEEVHVEQGGAEQAFASVVQLLESRAGERFVRFAYTRDGRDRRGPVTLRLEDVDRLRDGLRERRGLARALGMRAR